MKKIIFILFILFSANLFSQEWEVIKVYNNEDSFFYDKSFSKKDKKGNILAITKEKNHPKREVINEKTNEKTVYENVSLIILQAINCNSKKVKILLVDYLDSAEENIIDERDFSGLDVWKNVHDNYLSELLFNRVCPRK